MKDKNRKILEANNAAFIDLKREINNLNVAIMRLYTGMDGVRSNLVTVINKLEEQLEVQKQIFDTKGKKEKNGLSQQEFYKSIKHDIDEVKELLGKPKSTVNLNSLKTN